MLRACYTTTIKPYRDSDREEVITWYFVPKDRPVCGYGRFASGNFTDEDDKWPGPGEVKGRPRQYSPGREPFRLAHHEPEGERDWWVNGCPVDAAGTLPRSRRGAPQHCVGGVPGLVLGGVGRFAWARVGGLMLGGSVGHMQPVAPRSPVRVAVGGFSSTRWSGASVSFGGVRFGGQAEDQAPANLAFGGSSSGTWAAAPTSAIGGVLVGGFSSDPSWVQTDCCPNPINRFLVLTIWRATGIYAEMEGRDVTLAYEEVRPTWFWAGTLMNSQDAFVESPSFRCTPSGWDMTMSGLPSSPVMPTLINCADQIFEGVFAEAQGQVWWHIGPVPPVRHPPAQSTGWVVVGGLSIETSAQAEVASGGVAAGGFSVEIHATVHSGGVAFGGFSSSLTGSAAASVGGVRLGGSAVTTSGSTATAAGGVVLGGFSVEDFDMVPIGEIRMFAADMVITDWLACNGQQILKADYPALWLLIGETYAQGGEPVTHFRVPDLRGRCAIAIGQGTGLANRGIGEKGGAELHTLTTAQIPSHTHTQTTVEGGPGAFVGNVSRDNASIGSFPREQTHATGGGQAHNNMQPFLALAFQIKAR